MWQDIDVHLKRWINFSTLWYQGRGQESWERRGCHTNPRSVSNTCTCTSSHACLMYRHTHLHTFSFILAAACKLCRQCLLSIYFFHNKTLLMKIKLLNFFFFRRVDHIPQKVEYDLSNIFTDLLNFAYKFLRTGGRLTYWFPVHRAK